MFDPYRQFVRSRLGLQGPNEPQAYGGFQPEGRVPLPGPGYGGPQPGGGYIPQESPIGSMGPHGMGMGIPEGWTPLPMGGPGPQPGGNTGIEGGNLLGGYHPFSKPMGPEGRVPKPNPGMSQPVNGGMGQQAIAPAQTKRNLYKELY